MKCPYCNRETSNPEPMTKVGAYCKTNGFYLTSELVNPGGRELEFEKDGVKTRVQLQDHCNWCDAATIKTIIKNAGIGY